MEKTLWHQWNISQSLIASKKNAWFYDGLLFEVVMVILKDKKNTLKKIQRQ